MRLAAVLRAHSCRAAASTSACIVCGGWHRCQMSDGWHSLHALRSDCIMKRHAVHPVYCRTRASWCPCCRRLARSEAAAAASGRGCRACQLAACLSLLVEASDGYLCVKQASNQFLVSVARTRRCLPLPPAVASAAEVPARRQSPTAPARLCSPGRLQRASH